MEGGPAGSLGGGERGLLAGQEPHRRGHESQWFEILLDLGVRGLPIGHHFYQGVTNDDFTS
ncbi:hypothetical protein CRG98_031368 [Punica granatum]|uniref:Uncharacterized protein n=1 Tax=Punica granatum TaxID=22663 RepID=A0A2I0IW93_PUNGR|nr:hypothetical protein CRG98_031368 [Punica granatum]